MARPNFIRMTQLEFDMSRSFVRYDEPTMQALQDCIVGNLSAQEASIRHNVSYTTFITRKRRFWHGFVLLSRSYQAVYGALPSDKVLYRFVPYSDGLLEYRDADTTCGYISDAHVQKLSVMAFNQVCMQSPFRSEKIRNAVQDYFCFGLNYEQAGRKQGITRQAVLQGCGQFYNALFLDDAAQYAEVEQKYLHRKIGVAVMSKEDFVEYLRNQ